MEMPKWRKSVAKFFYNTQNRNKGLILRFEEACVVGVTFALILNFVLFVFSSDRS